MNKPERYSVLLLDDNAVLVGVYQRQLEHIAPFRVVAETDGRRARRLALSQLFDLVVIDAKLAYRGLEFGGLRLADDLRPRYGKNSILVISRFITAELVKESEPDYDFMEKHDDAKADRFIGALSDRLVQMRRSQYAFVAMPFDEAYDDLYTKHIRRAVSAAGFDCVRADEVHHNRGVQHVTFDLVQRSKLVVFVADGDNPNAYYEAGYADAMGKEVIIVSRDRSTLRVDVSNRHTIAYGSRKSRVVSLLTKKIAALRFERLPGG
jgi:CheY-like chemotaxis protein